MSSTRPEAEGFGLHEHDRRRARAAAEAAARAGRLRLTPARAFALEALLASERALSAYELLDRMREAGLGGQPPAAYRALDFLVANGLAHRIERLAAYVACTGGERPGQPAGFIVCRGCRRVAETPLAAPARELDAAAAAAGFTVERIVVEAEGLCAACRSAA